jgi:hypothetical protein
MWLRALVVVGIVMSALNTFLVVRTSSAKAQREKYFHQLWLNFAGSAAGWAALIFLIGRLQSVGAAHVAYIDIVIFVISLLGVVGLLPQMLAGLVNTVGDLARRIAEKAVG